ncbi:MAG: site-specific integrase [Chloroflexi bacterium]|nr:site-specific integrase [Chloroflexota bacterium]
MQRRTKGQGSIRLRTDGRWEVRMWLAGRRYTRALPARTTRRDAERIREDLARADREGRLVGTPKQTVAVYLRSWLSTTGARTLRPRSLERYTGVLERHVLPTCGHLALERFSPQHVGELHALWGRTLSSSSVRYNHAVLRSAFTQAVEWRMLERNPVSVVRAPRRVRRPMQVLSPAQTRTLCEAVRGTELEALYVLAVTTGLRLGELLGLQWTDVELADQSRPRLTVQRTLVRVAGRWLFGEPKSDRSRRGIALSVRAASALRAHRVRQVQWRLAAGASWGGHDLVFADQRGEPLFGPHITERCLKPLLRKLGLPVIRFHDLRHTAATLLLTQGINPKVVSEMLGHADIGLTLETYTHVLPDMQAQVATAMDAALS